MAEAVKSSSVTRNGQEARPDSLGVGISRGYLGQAWSASRAFRVTLTVTLVYTLLRLTIQAVYLCGIFVPAELKRLDGAYIPNDLRVYLEAADRLQNRQDLYQLGPLSNIDNLYQYSPTFALTYTPFLRLPPTGVVVAFTLLNIGSYGLLYLGWARIFHRLGLARASRALARTLPVWLIFASFWSDLGYLNIYIVSALLATLLLDAVLQERLGWSLLWLSIILQVKPQWAFAAALPLLLGQRRFFFRLLTRAIAAYVIILAVTVLAVGPSYGWQQYRDYTQYLANLTDNFPWRGPERGFLGYNHSIVQVVVYLLGFSENTLRLANLVKGLLLAPLVLVSGRQLLWPVRAVGDEAAQTGLDWALALYTGAFIWLDMVWELSLGIAVFAYLLATLNQGSVRTLVWAVFLPYAALDVWRVISFLALGSRVFAGAYLITDPSIYLPLIMIATLTFHGLLIARLWARPPASAISGR